MREVVNQIAPLSPDAHLILVTNPSDVMAQVALRESGFAPEKVIGLGGVLDTARYRTFLAEAIGVSYKNVTAFVLGGHGVDMVPLVRYSYAGGEIVNHLKTGSAFYAPASSAVAMMESILLDEKRILPVSAYVDGEYGMNGLFLGVPCILGADGVEKIVEIGLSEEEQKGLEKSAGAVKSVLDKL